MKDVHTLGLEYVDSLFGIFCEALGGSFSFGGKIEQFFLKIRQLSTGLFFCFSSPMNEVTGPI